MDAGGTGWWPRRMALRALAQEAWTVGSALLRRSIHSSATTSCLHAARQVPALQSCAGLSTSSGRSLPGLTRGFAAQASYSDEEIREIEARIFGSHIGEHVVWVLGADEAL